MGDHAVSKSWRPNTVVVMDMQTLALPEMANISNATETAHTTTLPPATTTIRQATISRATTRMEVFLVPIF